MRQREREPGVLVSLSPSTCRFQMVMTLLIIFQLCSLAGLLKKCDNSRQASLPSFHGNRVWRTKVVGVALCKEGSSRCSVEQVCHAVFPRSCIVNGTARAD